MEKKFPWLLALNWLFILVQAHTIALDRSSTLDTQFRKLRHDKALEARDLTVEQAISKGTLYEQAMESSGAEAQAVVNRIRNGVPLNSAFNSYQDLARWGWVKQDPDSEEEDDLYQGSLDQTFAQLEICEAQNEYVSWMQEKQVRDNNGQIIQVSIRTEPTSNSFVSLDTTTAIIWFL